MTLTDDVVELAADAVWRCEGFPDALALASEETQDRLKHVARAALEAAMYGEIREALRLMVESFEHSNNELLGHEEEALKLARALLSSIGTQP